MEYMVVGTSEDVAFVSTPFEQGSIFERTDAAHLVEEHGGMIVPCCEQEFKDMVDAFILDGFTVEVH